MTEHPTRTPPASAPPSRTGGAAVRWMFAIYAVLLVWIVLWKLEAPFTGEGGLRGVKLIPFAATAEHGASEPSEVLANLLLFVPFGVYLSLVAPAWALWKRLAAIAGASALIEALQLVLIVGSADVTDVVVNTAGGLAGIALVALGRRRWGGRATAVLTRLCAIGTVVAVLLCAVLVASPLHLVQHDVIRPVGALPRASR